MRKVLITIFVLALLASRFINLDRTARFIWDESSDLVKIHQIYVDKQLTLVGPISEDGTKIFGSLTYYMLLPFAIAGKFDPVSTAYGAAFWGVLTGILILYLTYKVNKKLVYLVAPIIILWYPLVETGRWAWNPNLIPFWVTLALIFVIRKDNLSKFLSGLVMGLTIHHHFLAVFAALGLGLFVFVDSIQKKEIKKFLIFSGGLLMAILPFVIFDLKNPPGLFLTRAIYFRNTGVVEQGGSVFTNFVSILNGTFQYFTQYAALKIALIVMIIPLIVSDFREKSRGLWFAGISLIQVVGLSLITNFYSHYILAAVPFFVVYLIYPRKSFGKYLAYGALIILLVSGISFPKQVTLVTWEGNIASTRFITNAIEDTIVNDEIKNVNIAVLASKDPNIYGRRYRDLLLIKDVNILSKYEYHFTDHLFVVSTSPIDVVRKDAAYEMTLFRNGPLVKEWAVPESPWKVYLFTKST